MAAGRGGLKIYDTHGGGELALVGSLGLPGQCSAVAAAGKTALVACGEAGVHALR